MLRAEQRHPRQLCRQVNRVDRELRFSESDLATPKSQMETQTQVLRSSARSEGFPERLDDLRALGHRDVSLPR